MTGIVAPRDIPIGAQSWTDETGRTWNSFGSLVLSDDLIQSTRQRLVEYLRGIPFTPSVQLYDFPPDNLKTPSIAVSPGDPYIVHWTQGGMSEQGWYLWNLELTIVVGRAKVDESLARLEFLFAQLETALVGFPNTAVIGLSDVGTANIGGIDYLTGMVTVEVADVLSKTEGVA